MQSLENTFSCEFIRTDSVDIRPEIVLLDF